MGNQFNIKKNAFITLKLESGVKNIINSKCIISMYLLCATVLISSCRLGSQNLSFVQQNSVLLENEINFELYGETKRCKLYHVNNADIIEKIIYVFDGQIFESTPIDTVLNNIKSASNALIVFIESSENSLVTEESIRHCEFLGYKGNGYSDNCNEIYKKHLDLVENVLDQKLRSLYTFKSSQLEKLIIGFSNSAGFVTTLTLNNPGNNEKVLLFSPAGQNIPSNISEVTSDFTIYYGKTEPLPFVLNAKELNQKLNEADGVTSKLVEYEGGHERAIWIKLALEEISRFIES